MSPVASCIFGGAFRVCCTLPALLVFLRVTINSPCFSCRTPALLYRHPGHRSDFSTKARAATQLKLATGGTSHTLVGAPARPGHLMPTTQRLLSVGSTSSLHMQPTTRRATTVPTFIQCSRPPYERPIAQRSKPVSINLFSTYLCDSVTPHPSHAAASRHRASS